MDQRQIPKKVVGLINDLIIQNNECAVKKKAQHQEIMLITLM
jgi:hypothetical protein